MHWIQRLCLQIGLFCGATKAFQPTTPWSSLTSTAPLVAPNQMMMDPFLAQHDMTSVLVSHQEMERATGVVGQVLSFPAFWSLSIISTLVLLLYGWEVFVETVRETLPKTFVPVFEKMWAEVAGLGFIGLFLEIVVHPFEHQLGELSEVYLGEEEALLETFEFLHAAFFQVGITYFVAAAVMVGICLRGIQQIKTLDGLGLDKNGSCGATGETLASYLKAPVLQIPPTAKLEQDESGRTTPGDGSVFALLPRPKGLFAELAVDSEVRCAQALMVRSYLVEEGLLSEETLIEPLLEKQFSIELLELVEVSPLTWLPLIPVLALANSIDLSHGVVNAASSNAAEAAGFFFSTPVAIFPSVAVMGLSLVWGWYNFLKVAGLKSMLLPSAIRQENSDGTTTARIIPPRFLIPEQVEEFLAQSNGLVHSLEKWTASVFAEEEKEEDENQENDSSEGRSLKWGSWGAASSELWGGWGAAGPELMLLSIRLHTWLCITSVVFFGTEIIPRDINVLSSPQALGMAGDPDFVLPELATYSGFVALSLGLLAISPITFLNYNLCSCFYEKSFDKDESAATKVQSAAEPEKMGASMSTPSA